jgi:hypothetical protein
MRGAKPSFLAVIMAVTTMNVLIYPTVVHAFSLCKSGSNQTPKQDIVTLKPNFWDKAFNNFQIWAISHPNNLISKLLLPPISVVEGILAKNHTYLDRKRLMFGDNFCCAGEVVLGDFTTLERALTSPQARTYRLGQTVLDRKNLMVRGRDLFLLALSDPQITEGDYTNGDTHAKVRKAVTDLITNDAALRRQHDSTAKQLLKEVAQDYRTMDHSTGGKFFTATDSGLKRFLIRYQHYVLFGLDPYDKYTMDLMTKLHFETKGAGHFFAVYGKISQLFNIGGAKKWPSLWKEASTIYKSSPSLCNVTNGQMAEYGFSLDEFATLLQPLLGLAAIPGPLSLANAALGAAKLPAYYGRQTNTIDQVAHWDDIKDLNDRVTLEKHMYECGRLWTPVPAVHQVATTDFVADMSLKKIGGESSDSGSRRVTFPKGTIIMVTILFGMLSEEVWGPTTYEYDSERKNLCPYSMIFNSVGDRSNGRICPGKDLATNLVVDLLQVLGNVRREEAVATS